MADKIERKKFIEKAKHLKIKVRPRAVILGVAALFILICSVFAVRINTYGKVYPGVSVMKIDLGGLSAEEAEKKITEEYITPLSNMSFTLRLQDRERAFSSKDIGALVDAKKTAEAAYNYGRDRGFFGKLKAYAKNKDISPVCSFDSEKIQALIDGITLGLETPVKEESFSLSGNTLIIENGKEGECVNREKASKQIEESVFLLSSKPITLKKETVKPKESGGDELYNKIISSEKDAYYERENGEIVVKEGFPKITVSKDEVKKAVKSGKDKYEITATTTPPKISAAKLKAMLYRDNMGSWTSHFSSSNKGRVANVRLSASRINGKTLMPGETFSYDKTIGTRTAANGYHTAGVYVGNKVEEGIGGGICQTSSTLYTAVLYSNLEIVSRTSHSLPVSYMPAGQDATIAEGSIDFKFKNNTDYPIKIVCSTTNSTVTCSIFGVKPSGETVEIVNTKTADFEPKKTRETDENMPVGYKTVKQKGAPGYAYSSQRIVKLNGKEQKRENLTKSTYRALDTIEIVNPKDKDTPSEELKIYSPEALNKPSEEPEKTEPTEEKAQNSEQDSSQKNDSSTEVSANNGISAQ